MPTFLYHDREYTADLLPDGRVRIEGHVYEAQQARDGSVRVGGMTAWVAVTNEVRWVFLNGSVFEFAEPRPRSRRRGTHEASLSAPMPATVRRLAVAPGDTVKNGDLLIVLEAMKMELPIRAARAGTVRQLHCEEGELVQPGVPLLDIEPDEPA